MKKICLSLCLLTLLASPAVSAEPEKTVAEKTASAAKAAQTQKPQTAKKEEIAEADDAAVLTEAADAPVTYIGEIEVVRSKFEDTLLEMGRRYNLGYVEMIAANPGVDPWLPGEGTKIILPKKHLLPDAPHEGLVINLAEMRMYDYSKDPKNPKTYPLGIGREGLNTPVGQTTIVRKKDGPTWRPTPRMRQEHPELPEAVPPGEDNPLGTHALYLGWPQYLIHGTHKPLGVGRRVSSGCMRMYPEDIIKVFNDIPVGTKVTVTKQPIKFAWINDMLYMEAHAEDELADSYEDIGAIKDYRVPETLFADVTKVAGAEKDRLDWKRIREEVKTRSGLPVPILTKDKPDEPATVTKDILKEELPVKAEEEDNKAAEEKKEEPVVETTSYNLNR